MNNWTLTDAPEGPGDPGVPDSPREPWAPSGPRAPVGPASPWKKVDNTGYYLIILHWYY